VIRSVLYLHPLAGNARAVAELYRANGVLDDAAKQKGCLGAELQLPLGGDGPVLITALWRDPAAYQGWVESPVRSGHGEQLAQLLEDDLSAELHGELYEIVLEAMAAG
jgi:heme-degrading monooxygenase HmoA